MVRLNAVSAAAFFAGLLGQLAHLECPSYSISSSLLEGVHFRWWLVTRGMDRVANVPFQSPPVDVFIDRAVRNANLSGIPADIAMTSASRDDLGVGRVIGPPAAHPDTSRNLHGSSHLSVRRGRKKCAVEAYAAIRSRYCSRTLLTYRFETEHFRAISVADRLDSATHRFQFESPGIG